MRLQVRAVDDDADMSDCDSETLAIIEYDEVNCRFHTVFNGDFSGLPGSVGASVMAFYVLSIGADATLRALDARGVLDADCGESLGDYIGDDK